MWPRACVVERQRAGAVFAVGLAMTDLTIEIERVVDRRAADDRIRHLEAQVDALRALIAELERKLGERAGEEGR